MIGPLASVGWGARARELQRVVLTAGDAPVWATPRRVVWQRNKARLHRYVRAAPAVHRTPVLIVGPLLLRRAYILDLCPGASFVAFLLRRGFDVFLLDWEGTGDEDQGVDLAALVEDYVAVAMQRASRAAGGSPLAVVGHSIGGIAVACALALHANLPAKHLVLVGTPLDLTDGGVPGAMLGTPGYPVDFLTTVWPVVPTLHPIPQVPDIGTAANGPCVPSRGFNPVPHTLAGALLSYLQLWHHLGDPRLDVRRWQAMFRWLNDAVAFPSAAFRQVVHDLYRANRLARGELALAGRRVDLSRVRCPLLNVAAMADTVAPRRATAATPHLVGSVDKEELVVAGGHLGMIVGCGADAEVWPAIADWLERRDR